MCCFILLTISAGRGVADQEIAEGFSEEVLVFASDMP